MYVGSIGNNLKCMSTDTKIDMVMLESHIDLETSLCMVQGLVYGIVNVERCIIHIAYTNNLYEAIGRLVAVLQSGSPEYGSMKDDIKQCKVVVLETGIEKGDLRLRTGYWISLYKDRKYSFYKELNPLLYTLETSIERKGNYLLYFVYLKSKGKITLVVGEFKKKREMTEWIRRNYPDTSRIHKIVYQTQL